MRTERMGRDSLTLHRQARVPPTSKTTGATGTPLGLEACTKGLQRPKETGRGRVASRADVVNAGVHFSWTRSRPRGRCSGLNVTAAETWHVLEGVEYGPCNHSPPPAVTESGRIHNVSSDMPLGPTPILRDLDGSTPRAMAPNVAPRSLVDPVTTPDRWRRPEPTTEPTEISPGVFAPAGLTIRRGVSPDRPEPLSVHRDPGRALQTKTGLEAYVPSAEAPWTTERAIHLLSRTGFGVRRDALEAVRQQGPAVVGTLMDAARDLPLTASPPWVNESFPMGKPGLRPVQRRPAGPSERVPMGRLHSIPWRRPSERPRLGSDGVEGASGADVEQPLCHRARVVLLLPVPRAVLGTDAPSRPRRL